MMVSDTLLFSMLEPRETCSPLQVLALHVSIKMIHTLYCFVPEEVWLLACFYHLEFDNKFQSYILSNLCADPEVCFVYYMFVCRR